MRAPPLAAKLGAGLLVVSLTLVASGARGEGTTRPLREAITVEGASACIDAPTMAAQLEHWLGRGDVDARLAVTIRVAPNAPSYVVQRDGKATGERSLHLAGATCAELRAALGLAIAVALDATLLESLGVVPPSSNGSPSPSLVPPPATPNGAPSSMSPPSSGARRVEGAPANVVGPDYATTTDDAPAPAPDLEVAKPVALPGLTMGVEAAALVGVLPDVAVGVAPALDFDLAKPLDLRLGALITSHVDVAVGAGSARVGLVAGRADLCAKARSGRARLRGCAGVTAGAMAADGFGFASVRSTVTPWVGPALRFDARWSFGRFGVGFSLDGFLPGLKPRLDTVDASGAISASRTLPLGGVAAGVGPSFAFW